MAYQILGTAKPAFFDTSGNPLVSGTLTVQDPTTSAAKAVYATAANADAASNGITSAITLDSRGEPTTSQLWGRDNTDYKVILKDSSGSTVYTIDNIMLPQHSADNSTLSIGASDATPSFDDGHYGQSGTTSTTDITAFDDGYNGKIIAVTNTSTGSRRIASNSNVKLQNALGTTLLENDHLLLISDNVEVWHELARAQQGPLALTKTADQTVTSSDTLADDTHMAAFQLAPQSYYKVSGFLKVNTGASSTPDIKLALQTDQTFQDAYWSLHSINDSGTIVGDSAVATTSVTLACVTGTVHGIKLDGLVKTHATAVSTVDLQWAQGTSDGTGTVMEVGSWLQFELIRSD